VAACCCIGLAAWGVIHHIQHRRSIVGTDSSLDLHPDASATAATPCSVALAEPHIQQELQPGIRLPSPPAPTDQGALPSSCLAAHVAAAGASAVAGATVLASSPLPGPVVLAAGDVDIPLGPTSGVSGRTTPLSTGKGSPLSSPRALIIVSPSHFAGAGGGVLATPDEDISAAGNTASGASGALQDLNMKARVVLLKAAERPLSPLGSPKSGPLGSPRSMPNLGAAATVDGVISALP
jgi:hypothetical protein